MSKEKNGCGIRVLGVMLRPPYSVFFKSSCDKHDIGYNKGGTWQDRFKFDLLFLAYMLYDVAVKYGTFRKIFHRTYFSLWAFVYFFAVRIGGSRQFGHK